MENRPVLWIITPCYNEQEVLPVTAPMFLEKLRDLVESGRVDRDSRVLFVDHGSGDRTWEIISELAEKDPRVLGIRQSRNRGHQNALVAGMMEARDHCDITITVDCDGQDDLGAMDEMVDRYLDGCEIVYGVRSDRDRDTWFKRSTAIGYYKVLGSLGAEVVYNHADYRLVSSRVLREFSNFREVNLYLRGMFPLVGFKSTSVYYSRGERLGGKSHYSLTKMCALAFDGITSLSIKPIHLITGMGTVVALISFAGVLWSLIAHILGQTVPGWASMTCIICFLGGIQLLSLGVIGEYVGKTYMETKQRPRYIISDRTWESSPGRGQRKGSPENGADVTGGVEIQKEET